MLLSICSFCLSVFRVAPASLCPSVIAQRPLSVTCSCGGHPFGLPQSSPSTTGFPSQLVLPFFPSSIATSGQCPQARCRRIYRQPCQGCASIFPPLPSYMLSRCGGLFSLSHFSCILFMTELYVILTGYI